MLKCIFLNINYNKINKSILEHRSQTFHEIGLLVFYTMTINISERIFLFSKLHIEQTLVARSNLDIFGKPPSHLKPV